MLECIMDNNYHMNIFRRALTILEMVIAIAMVATIFAALLPQFQSVQNSWEVRRGKAQTTQNARVLIDHLNRTLAQARQITAVSPASQLKGFIEYEDAAGKPMRIEVSADSYVQIGPVGNLADLAGPVSRLRFVCYDIFDLDTPIMDPKEIRCVKIETILANTEAFGQDKTYKTTVFLRTNYNQEDTNWEIRLMENSRYELDIILGATPELARIDDDHFLCVYSGPGTDGWAVVIEVDTDNWTLSKAAPQFEFDIVNAIDPALAKISDTHYLCVYTHNSDGYAVILNVNPATWGITRGAPFVFDTSKGFFPALARVNATHYLCTYRGQSDDGWATVLAVNTATETVSKSTSFEFETSNCRTLDMCHVVNNKYLCVYMGPNNDGWAVVLDVNLGTYAITKHTPFEYDSTSARTPALQQIDAGHYFCAYAGISDNGQVIILRVNQATWNITRGPPFQYDGDKAITPEMGWIKEGRFVILYEGPSVDAFANQLVVDTNTWAITMAKRFEYDPVSGATPALARIDQRHYLSVYQGANNDGWSVILWLDAPILP